MNTAIIVQARMTSTRLPGKILLPVLGKSLLEYQLERLRRVHSANEIIIATTKNDTDQPVIDLCDRLGPEDDVLARYYGAATDCQADVVVRVTADCPIIDPAVVEQLIAFYLARYPQFDYVSNCLESTYPIGMDAEVIPMGVLTQAYFEAKSKPDREHVTPFIYRHPERFRLGNVAYRQNQSIHRWTVDTPEDFALISRIIEKLYPVNPNFNFEDILQLMAVNPNFFDINCTIKQKQYGE